jgi:hypothetical protein
LGPGALGQEGEHHGNEQKKLGSFMKGELFSLYQ